jgi:hydroxymethylbilane synthase
LELYPLPFEVFLPAPAQGALAFQTRAEDTGLNGVLRRFTHRESLRAVTAERCFLRHFGGGCHVPIGALAMAERDSITLSGVVASVDGKRLMRRSVTGDDPESLGEKLADILKKEGADELI